MAFFPRNDTTSFTPLLRLLDDFDNYSRQFGTPTIGGSRSGLQAWQPKFDVRETGEAYELHGELPGMSKENVNIEFVEPQVMAIRGKVERQDSRGTPPSGQLESTNVRTTITEGKENEGTTTEKTSGAKQNETGGDKSKYWLTERSIGEFSRTFNFPARIDQEGVTANLKDGVLSVFVPKATKHEIHRRIAIN